MNINMDDVRYQYAIKNLIEGKYVSAKAAGGYLYTRKSDAKFKAQRWGSYDGNKYAIVKLALVPVPDDEPRDKRKTYCYTKGDWKGAQIYLRKPQGSCITYELVEVDSEPI